MRIDSPQSSNASLTGSFSGSFTGVGSFEGLTADSVEFANVLNKPSLHSGSAQVSFLDLINKPTNFTGSYIELSNIPSGIVSSSAQIDLLFDIDGVISGSSLSSAAQGEVALTTNGVAQSAVDLGLQTADSPTFAGLTVNGNIGVTGTVDGRDIATDGQKLDGIESGATADLSASEIKTAYESNSDTNAFTDALLSKLNDIEASADVTDTANVTSAGALMDSEVTSLSGIKTLTVPDSTTISTFGATLIDDADASAARTTLGVDAAGTDNSTDVTLAGTPDYITISGQVITRNKIDLSTDVTGTLPVGNMSATALTTVQTAANESAQLALTTQEGDVVVRTDESKTYMHNGGTAGTMADFTELATPTDSVTSVNGNTGAVTVVENVTTNLSTTANGTSLTINSSDGTNASIPAATTSAWGAMTDEDKTKLDGIETNADVTDTANVTAAGALMDSEVTNLAQVKAFDSSDYATAAQGTKADAALPKSGGQMTGNITFSGTQTVDGRDLSADGAKLDNIEANADVTDTANVTAAGALMDSELTNLAAVKAINQSLVTTADVRFDSLGIGTAASGTTGEIRATGDITAYYSSDERLKENFKTLDGALDKVNQLNGYEFDWKEGIEGIVSKKGHDIGVKAQEVQALYPELVHERDNGYLAVDYVKLTAVLLQAVKELSVKVADLEKK